MCAQLRGAFTTQNSFRLKLRSVARGAMAQSNYMTYWLNYTSFNTKNQVFLSGWYSNLLF